MVSAVWYTPLFGYLLMIGWLEKRVMPLLISVFVLLKLWRYIWGVLPTQPMVAWLGAFDWSDPGDVCRHMEFIENLHGAKRLLI